MKSNEEKGRYANSIVKVWVNDSEWKEYNIFLLNGKSIELSLINPPSKQQQIQSKATAVEPSHQKQATPEGINLLESQYLSIKHQPLPEHDRTEPHLG